MEKLRIWNSSATDDQITMIANRLKQGDIAIIPTDSTYAIAGDALNVKAVERICRLKGINPEKTSLSILCSDISMASEYSRIENSGFRLLKDHTPGPFTFLFKAAGTLPRAFKGRKVVGIRIPANDFALKLSRALGNPLISTSIPYAEEDYAVNPDLIAESFEGKVDIMVDNGDGATDVTTIVDCTGSQPEITRIGLGQI